MKRLNFLVYDFETSDSNAETCYPLEIACVAIDGRELEYIDGSLFISHMKPSHLDTLEKVMEDQNIKDSALEVNGINRAEIHTFPDEKIVWNNFVNHCLKYSVGKSPWDRAVCIGWNINKFDNILVDLLTTKYKTKFPFHKTISLDLMVDWFSFIENLSGEDEVTSLSFDFAREYLEMPDLIAERGHKHSGKRDVLDNGDFFIRFQSWKRKLGKKANFKGSFKTQI
jgi:hypothetical protein